MGPDLDAFVNLDDFERAAEACLDRAAFDYIAGGAGDELTLRENVAAFRRWRLVPRVLTGAAEIDLRTSFLGTPVSLPVGIAPAAFQHLAHPDAEAATAGAAAEAGALFCLSTVSSRSIEEVAAAADEGADQAGRRWFQLYVHRNRDRTADLVKRAEAAGYSALVVTADFPVAGNRERDARSAFAYPQQFGNFAVDPAELPGAGDAGVQAVIGGFNDPTFTWRDLARLRDLTSLPIVVKGILSPADAKRAVKHGAAAVIVSNHGGRQLDRTPGSLDQLPAVVDAVADRAEVYLDGGVRRGADVLIALALGARGVFIGRPAFFALAAAGRVGVRRALGLLEAELRTDMLLLGVPSLSGLTRKHVQRA